MTVNPVRHGPYPSRLDADSISAFAAATGDDTASVLEGRAIPVTYPVILVLAAVEEARADVPAEAWRRVRGGVHGRHDIVLHRRLHPDEALTTWSQICAVRTSRAGTQVSVHLDQVDGNGLLAVEQWWTMVLLGLAGLPVLGMRPPEHRFPRAARTHPAGSTRFHVDAKAAHRYAAVSGDWSAHDFDLEAARAAGFGFVFAHGLCTMAICAPACSPFWVLRIPAASAGWQSGSRRPHRWTAI